MIDFLLFVCFWLALVVLALFIFVPTGIAAHGLGQQLSRKITHKRYADYLDWFYDKTHKKD